MGEGAKGRPGNLITLGECLLLRVSASPRLLVAPSFLLAIHQIPDNQLRRLQQGLTILKAKGEVTTNESQAVFSQAAFSQAAHLRNNRNLASWLCHPRTGRA